MKVSNFYLNALLTGLVVLLTFVLALLYLVQPGGKLPERYIYGADDTPATYGEIEEIELKIGVLETLVAKEKELTKEQNNLQEARARKLMKQLSDLTAQLEETIVSTQEAQKLLNQERTLTERLSVQLSSEKALSATQINDLTSSSAEVLLLGKSLQEEKDFVLKLRTELETEKLQLLNLSNELDLKKRELVRNKRELTKSIRALTAKKRELTISKSVINDIKRKNESLNRKLSILDNEASNIRQTSRNQSLTSSPNS